GEHRDQSSRIQAATPLCAPSDISLYDVVARSEMLKRVFGSNTGINPNLLRASPVTFVTKDDPPFLIFQGDQDTVVAPQHSEKLYAKLTTAGVSAALITVKNATHCLPPQPEMSPSRAEISKLIADFFDQVLRR
ncbi:MAG: prolyl oligopeptidase family serine peptidase, partial [Chloroflexota bacterium]